MLEEMQMALLEILLQPETTVLETATSILLEAILPEIVISIQHEILREIIQMLLQQEATIQT